ncbi:hypothetical protein AVEN_269208-1 [Araneus ventricosus]|uniref:DDE-1 domain-containing protein n=1 Tax=Araneus ventricosus TaxID=182803 RepID=A0A4Y2I3H8_ARAVE|nr:hypothetical protein AVEN_269208-1 [Araneus ventricosus]
MNETGISTVPNRTPNVITPKGYKTACKISSAERGQKVTAVCCMSATGVFVPATSILPRKRMNPLLYKDAPNGTLPLISDTGYMNSHLFINWLKHFVNHAKPSAEDPVLKDMGLSLRFSKDSTLPKYHSVLVGNRNSNPLCHRLPSHSLLPYGTTQPTSASLVPQRSQQFNVKKEDP